VNVLENQDITIRILSTFRIYEGCFFALKGEARPEGGKFHFSGPDNSIVTDASTPGVDKDLLKRYNNWRADPALPAKIQTPAGDLDRAAITAKQAVMWVQNAGGWGPFTRVEWDMLANNYHTDPSFATEPGLLNPAPKAIEADKGAPLKERAAIRAKMIDGSPDSFWECEYIIDASEALKALTPAGATQPEGGDTGGKRSVQDVMTYGEAGASQEAQQEGVQLTLGELIDKISGPAIDKMDLDATILLELKEPKIINWLNLTPHNFSDTSWLEVLDVSTSKDGANWEEVEGLHDSKFENILTEEANAELTPDEVAVTLAPNKFQYTGQGVWTFPAREVKFIRFKLLQKTPIPAPYDVLMVELSQTVTATHTAKETWGPFGF